MKEKGWSREEEEEEENKLYTLHANISIICFRI